MCPGAAASNRVRVGVVEGVDGRERGRGTVLPMAGVGYRVHSAVLLTCNIICR